MGEVYELRFDTMSYFKSSGVCALQTGDVVNTRDTPLQSGGYLVAAWSVAWCIGRDFQISIFRTCRICLQ